MIGAVNMLDDPFLQSSRELGLYLEKYKVTQKHISITNSLIRHLIEPNDTPPILCGCYNNLPEPRSKLS